MSVILRTSLRKHFFFEKKKQKTFTHWSPVARQWHTPNGEKFFGSFFKKELLAFT